MDNLQSIIYNEINEMHAKKIDYYWKKKIFQNEFRFFSIQSKN